MSQNSYLAKPHAYARFMRMGAGPDPVHLSGLCKALVKRHGAEPAAATANAELRGASQAWLFPR